MYRQRGKPILQRYIKTPSNLDIIEKYIFARTNDEQEYIALVYETIGALIHGTTLKELCKRLHHKRFGWSHPSYDELRTRLEEEDTFTTTPVEVEEGILECGKCGSKKTFSFQKQTRSIDEGATTFAQCAVCKNSWRHYN